MAMAYVLRMSMHCCRSRQTGIDLRQSLHVMDVSVLADAHSVLPHLTTIVAEHMR